MGPTQSQVVFRSRDLRNECRRQLGKIRRMDTTVRRSLLPVESKQKLNKHCGRETEIRAPS